MQAQGWKLTLNICITLPVNKRTSNGKETTYMKLYHPHPGVGKELQGGLQLQWQIWDRIEEAWSVARERGQERVVQVEGVASVKTKNENE